MRESERDALLKCILASEAVNEQLVITLRYCIKLLTEFKEDVPDPEGWQDMLGTFEETLKSAEAVHGRGTFH